MSEGKIISSNLNSQHVKERALDSEAAKIIFFKSLFENLHPLNPTLLTLPIVIRYYIKLRIWMT